MMGCASRCFDQALTLLLICLHFASAIDNVECDFEAQNVCNWRNYDVTTTINRPQGTNGDWSTTGTSLADVGHTGRYARLRKSGTLLGDVNARTEGLLVSPVISSLPASTPGCLQFRYFTFGQSSDLLEVYLIDSQLKTGPLLWKVTGDQSRQWKNASAPLYYTKPFQLVLYGVISGQSSNTIIAIDDVSFEINKVSCRMTPLDADTGHDHTSLTMTGLIAATTVSTVTDCNDDPHTDCWSRPDTDCFGIYEPWSRAHCALRCGFCPGKPPPCEDKLPRCDQFPESTCKDTNYQLWARTNCRQRCHLCHVPTPPPTSSPATTTATTRDPNGCYDKPQANCWSRPDDDCFYNYMAWSRQNCPQRCGFCSGQVPCEDAIANCHQYQTETCTDPNYLVWARTNCRRRCNLCNVPTTPAGTGPTTATTTSAPTCMFKGMVYQSGSVWEDGCQYHCFCNNGINVCNDKCLVLNVPSSCTSHLLPSGCCPTYTCPSGTHPSIVVG